MQLSFSSTFAISILLVACSSSSSPDAHISAIDAKPIDAHVAAIDAHVAAVDAHVTAIDAAANAVTCATLEAHSQETACSDCLEGFETNQNQACDSEVTAFNTDCAADTSCRQVTSGSCYVLSGCNPAPTTTCNNDVAAYNACVVNACMSACAQ